MNEENGLIDAVQDELSDATNEIVEVVEVVAEDIVHGGHEHEGPFYIHADFWVAVSFVLVVLLLIRPVKRIVSGMMDKQIKGIADRIDEVVQLKGDAQRLLVEYERKFGNIENEIYQILERSKREIDMIKREKLGKLERNLHQREKDAENRIERASCKAIDEVKALSSDLAIETVKSAIRNKLSEKTKDQLIEQSIANLDKVV